VGRVSMVGGTPEIDAAAGQLAENLAG